MGLVQTPKINDPDSVRKCVQQISTKLGPNGSPTFSSLTVTNGITAYGGRDVIRYAYMMALITRRDH